MLSDCSQNEVRSSQVIVGNLSSLEIDSNHLSYERLSSMLYVGMDGIGLDGMVVMGNRYSKSTTGANNYKNSLTIVKA